VRIEYEDSSVEKYFKNLDLMKKKIGLDLTKITKKRQDQLRASDNFSIYLSTGLGKPHPLFENLKGCYGISLTGKMRLIVKPDVEELDPKSLINCEIVIIKGVMDYHGRKNEWIIP